MLKNMIDIGAKWARFQFGPEGTVEMSSAAASGPSPLGVDLVRPIDDPLANRSVRIFS